MSFFIVLLALFMLMLSDSCFQESFSYYERHMALVWRKFLEMLEILTTVNELIDH